MDRIIKITLGLFIAILAVTLAYAGFTAFVTGTYQSTLVSTYTYSCSITTDSALGNVTLFIPVPADQTGNSPVVSRFSARQVQDLPDTWETTLFDTGKATLVKVSIPSLVPPAGTTPSHPYTVMISTEVNTPRAIDTADPMRKSAVFRPVQNQKAVPCDAGVIAKGGSPACYSFLTSLYADYEADPNTAVTITSSITGKNSWSVFGPESNEYTSDISLLLHGENHGWQTVKGSLEEKIGSYKYPFHIP
ncbi:MAG: hypothetical protein GYA23_04125 [Methanomicrobiales archaeon]|nr:hypothetical protein [Methanomicrobiales archaeon]